MKGALPIVDMGAFLEGSTGDAAAAREMEKACREFGFFYATGHGVGGETVRALKETSARFFALPVASKMKIPLARGGLVHTVECRFHDAGVLAGLDPLLQSVALRATGDLDEGGHPVERREDVVLDGSGLDHARPANHHRGAHATLPGGDLAALEGGGAAVREGLGLGAVVGREDDDGVVGLPHVVDLLEHDADIVVHLTRGGKDWGVNEAGMKHRDGHYAR